MRRLNAIDAIGPAWEHTQALMFAPKRWKLMLKIGTVAFFAEMGGCNANFNGPMRSVSHIPHAALLGLLVVIGVGALVLFLVTFYVASRLQFVLFEMVLRRDTWVAPIWRRYGAATWRWIGLKVLFLIAALVCMIPLLVPIVLFFVHMARAGKNAAGHVGMTFAMIFGVFVVTFVVVIAILCVYLLLSSFGLPSMALEGTSLGETVRRVWWLLRSEPWQVLAYVAMRVLLNFAIGIGCELCLLVAGLVLAIPLGGAGFGLWMALRHASLGGHVVMVMGWVVLGAIFTVLMFIGVMIVLGGLMVFLEAYGLYFLGGRYPLVGEYLEPTPVFVAPPPLPLPE